MQGLLFSRGPATALVTVIAALVLYAGSVHASDDEAVRAAALDYAEGWYAGDAERLAQALHPEAVKRRVVKDVVTGEERVNVLGIEDLLRGAREGVGREPGGPVRLRVAVLDQHGDMAVARVVSMLYVDYLQLVRWNGRWVVLSVVWGTIESPGE
ncbi:nuclear transport factor 2 family protein [Wenzhouxiangella sp. XN24]|uniref:nuclear transport factor 2 family protein n=1 Tax=Wenzhouxiangella sp. XN24 TaxID=2713569 RepID=UPI0013EB26D2|nr:nuclear transport factor 2 family protein [Wenzhouxiangella sp. XN24]NGX15136.1 nuclear transport factor 2 family protein [Wenzhouxiangella sp. XN24]